VFSLQAFKSRSLALPRSHERTLARISYALVFVYTFVVALLLGHKDISFIFVALFFIVAARNKWIFNASLIAITAFAVSLSPCMVYGKIHSDLVLNVLVADNVHALEFITALPAKLFASVAFVLGAACMLIRLRSLLLVTNFSESKVIFEYTRNQTAERMI